jgi:hypothetical protein
MRAAICCAVAIAFLAGGTAADSPSVKEIMGKANKPTGIYFTLALDLKDDNPSWPDIQQEAKDLAKLAAALRQATPPRGEKESWEKLTKTYADNAKALEQATAKMDQKAAQTAHARMGGDACMTCHKAHKPPE